LIAGCIGAVLLSEQAFASIMLNSAGPCHRDKENVYCIAQNVFYCVYPREENLPCVPAFISKKSADDFVTAVVAAVTVEVKRNATGIKNDA